MKLCIFVVIGLMVIAMSKVSESALACRAPASWVCDSGQYNSGDGCHCGCGVYDPDCDLENQQIVGCQVGEFCSYSTQCKKCVNEEPLNAGVFDGAVTTGSYGICKVRCAGGWMGEFCQYEAEAPSGWICEAENYAAQDGCHCGCGAVDADCGINGQVILGCELGQQCDLFTGQCIACYNQVSPSAGAYQAVSLDNNQTWHSVVADLGGACAVDCNGEAGGGVTCASPCSWSQCGLLPIERYQQCMNSSPMKIERLDALAVLDSLDNLMDFYAFTDWSLQSPENAHYPLSVDLRAALADIRSSLLSGPIRLPSAPFHESLATLFNSLRDAHTAYIKPDSYSSNYAIFPFTFASFVDDDDDGLQKILIDGTFFPQLEAFIGMEVVSFDDTPAVSYLLDFALHQVGISRDVGTRFNLALSRSFSIRSFHAGSLMDVPASVSLLIDGLLNPVDLPFFLYSFHEIHSVNQLLQMELRLDAPVAAKDPFDSIGAMLELRLPPLHLFNYTSHESFQHIGQQLRQLLLPLLPDGKLPQAAEDAAADDPADDDDDLIIVPIVQTNEIESYQIGADSCILKISSFSPSGKPYGQEFRMAVTYTLQYAQDNNLHQLLLDLRDNGGGSICLGYSVLHYLLGDEFNPYGDYDFPAPEIAQEMARKSVDSAEETLWSPEYWVSTLTKENFEDDSWMIPARSLTRNGKESKWSQRVHDDCYANFEQWLKPHHYSYNPTQILVLTKGYCGSTCAVFSKHLEESDKVRTLVVGGVNGVEQSTASFPGGQVYTLGSLFESLDYLNLTDRADSPQLFPFTGRFSFTVREIYSWTPGLEEVPLDFVFEASDFRMPFSKRSASSDLELYLEAMEFFQRCRSVDETLSCPVAHGSGAYHCVPADDDAEVLQWEQSCNVHYCVPGYYYNEHWQEGPDAHSACRPCPEGTFNAGWDLLPCVPCTGPLPMHAEYTGIASSNADCPWHCQQGYYGDQCEISASSGTTPSLITTPHPQPPSSASSSPDSDMFTIVATVLGILIVVALVIVPLAVWLWRRYRGAPNDQQYASVNVELNNLSLEVTSSDEDDNL